MQSTSHRFTGISISHNLDHEPLPKKFNMHTHRQFEIYCFLRGKGVYHIEGSEYILHFGDILLMRPGEAHFFELDPQHPYERITFHVDTNYFSDVDPENSLLRPIFDRKAGKQNLYRASDFPNNGYMNYIQNATLPTATPLSCLANLILLMQEIGNIFDSNPTINEPNSIQYQLIGYINRHLSEPLTIQQLCDTFYLSRAELCRRFKKATGTSIGKYISVKRLLHARQLILQGRKPTEIYQSSGYQDYSTFYRAYVQYFGCCPRDDRQDIPISDRFEIT